MNFRSLIALFALAFSLLAPPAWAAAPVILYPTDLTLVRELSTKIYVFAPGISDPLPVVVNGTEVAKLEGGDFRIGEITLNNGLNFITVGDSKAKVFSVPNSKLTTFSLKLGNEGEAFVFGAQNIHPALPDGCDSCHTVEGGKAKAKDQKEACFACHTDTTKPPEEGKPWKVHPPIASGECTSCHDPHFSPRARLMKSDQGCLECHSAPSKDMVVHRPVADLKCVSCHSPHAGPGDRITLRPGNSLCKGCHPEYHKSHRAAEVRRIGMTEIPKRFPQDNTDFACLGCHKAHQSEYRRLFVKPQGELCKTCHLM